MDLLLCRAESQLALLDELARTFPSCAPRVREPGIVEGQLPPAPGCVAFATQVLPDAQPIAATSIHTWGQALGEALIGGLEDHPGPWRLHVLARGGVTSGRAHLIEESALEHLKRKQRRLLRTRVREGGALFHPEEALAQLLLTGSERGFTSLALPARRQALHRVLSGFPGGEVSVERDPRPPSRAYGKLVEAELRGGRRIGQGERCVDLGASPGGWSFIALERGAQVIAVDRSPLRDDLMRNPRLTFVKGDAFTWRPEAPVDWLLCDLIAFPERTLALLETWLSARLCKRFCVTMKFRGSDDHPRVDALKALLERHARAATVCQLTQNKNEVTALGETSFEG